MTDDHPATSEGGGRNGYLTTIGEMAALAALLLPAAGVVVRWIAFSLDTVEVPALTVALSTSLPHLVATGLLALIQLWPMLVLLPLLVGIERRHIAEGRHVTPEWAKVSKNKRRLALAASVLITAPLILFSAPWPTILLTLAFGFVAGMYVARLGTSGRVTLGRTWPIVVSGVLLGALVAPLVGRVAALPGGYYSMRSEPEPTWFYELGRTDTVVYLRTCDDEHPSSEAISPTAVESITFDVVLPPRKSPGTSLWDVLRGERVTMGVQYPCPE